MKGCILLYHRVEEAPNKQAAKTTLFVHPDHFAWQMTVLRRLFRVMALEEFVRCLKTGTLPHRAVAITFDDGTVDFVERALPILAHWQIPVTLFVVSGKLGQTTDWLDRSFVPPAALLTADQLRSLPPFVDLGAHSRTHRRLSTLPEQELMAEVRECKSEIEQVTGKPVRWFAYPFGDVLERVATATRQAGYWAAFGAKRGWAAPNSDPFLLPRLAVPYWVGRVGFLLWLRLAPTWRARRRTLR